MAAMAKQPVQLTCDALRDAAGTNLRGGSVIVRDGCVVEVRGQPDADLPTRRIEGLLMPAMVNAHAHLDLTSMGPQPYTGDFMSWGTMVMEHRQKVTDTAASVALGVRMSRDAGVGVVGDVAGEAEAAAALAQSGMTGVSFLECFGHGLRQDASIERIHEQLQSLSAHETDAWRVGAQPHAPYSAGLRVYGAAAQTGRPVCTHLAEMREELQFVRDAAGPIADRLKSWGKWDDTIAPTNLHPVDWLAPRLQQAPWLLAHCNYVDDDHIALLARCGASVVYCPVASEYFGHEGHRYRDMLGAGINVCLGADSILCQPPDETQPMSILAPMRRLYERDATSPDILLAMATVNGAKALRRDADEATLLPGAPARFAVVPFDTDNDADPLTQVLASRYPVGLLDLTGGPGDGE